MGFIPDKKHLEKEAEKILTTLLCIRTKYSLGQNIAWRQILKSEAGSDVEQTLHETQGLTCPPVKVYHAAGLSGSMVVWLSGSGACG